MKKIVYMFLSLMLLTSAGCSQSTASMTQAETTTVTTQIVDGTYNAVGKGNNGDVNVTVAFEEGKIVSVEVGEHSETAGICEPAIEKIPASIVENQSILVDTVSGATNTSNAIISAVKDCINQAGGSESEFAVEIVVEKSDAVEEYIVDVVVVGGGGSGVSAALAAHQAGAEVFLMEKTANLGGSSVMSMGMGAWNSQYQQDDPDTDFTAGEWLKDWLAQQNYMVSAPMIYKYITESGKTVDWLSENGVEFNYVGHSQTALLDETISTYHQWAGNGLAAALNTIADTIVDEGGIVMKETTGKEILMEDGKVAGVRGEKADGTSVVVHADAVIISTGGYGANEEKMIEVLGFKSNGINSGAQMGEGIDMGIAVGAATDGLTNVEFHGINYPLDLAAEIDGDVSLLMNMAQNPSTVWINVDGYRFTNEDICFDSAYVGNVTATQGDHYYAILDQKTLDTLETEGEAALGRTTQGTGFNPPELDQPWTGLSEQIELGLENGMTVKADTLEELAEKCGINADKLIETIEVYNASCQEGVDEMYDKPAQYLTSVSEGPYYAIMGRSSELCTLGGLKITTDMEVVSTEGDVIPGLYSAGVDCSGSMYNNAYVSYEGVTMGWTMTSGRLAGENAASYAVE